MPNYIKACNFSQLSFKCLKPFSNSFNNCPIAILHLLFKTLLQAAGSY